MNKDFTTSCISLSILLVCAPHRGTSIRPVVRIPGQGGPDSNGTAFDDVSNVTRHGLTVCNIQSISIVSYYQVDSIQVTYLLSNGSFYKAPKHGEVDFSFPETITLDPDEFVQKIEGKTNGIVINQLTITTWRPKEHQSVEYGPYGMTNTGKNFTFEGFIVGFHGRSGSLMENIGVYKLAPMKKSYLFGIPYFGVEFDDNPDTPFPPVVGINKLFIYHGRQINSIQAEYQLFGGGTLLSERHGTAKNNLSTVIFSYGEAIVEMKGLLDYPKLFLKQLTFVTKRHDGKMKVYGPFGKTGSKPFSVRGYVIGLAGRASNFLQAISAYYCSY